MTSVRARARLLIASSGAVILLVVLGLAAVLVQGAGDFATRNADQRAQLGVDLLVTVGTNLPDFTPRLLQQGLTTAERAALDTAVTRGQRRGVLSDVTVWDRGGRVVYSADPRLEGTRPSLSADLTRALHGASVAQRNPTDVDETTGLRTGVLDALQPLRDADGRIYGVLETSLPLRGIAAESSDIRSHILVFLIASAVILWLLLLPIILRSARDFAASWVPGRRRLLKAFGHALADDEIEIVYQPQADPRTHEIRSVEALVRWRRGGTLRPPADFLAAVENSPLMPQLTDRVLDLALGQLAAWTRAGSVSQISVNLAASDLVDPDLVLRIQRALLRHAVEGHQVTLEVTETGILNDPEGAQQALGDIAALGVAISVDDFGTGYASISRLHQLPVREVKVDRSFAMAADPHTRAFLIATVRFGRALGLRVVVEGVEDAETFELLAGLGCDLVQGYHLTAPLSGPDLEAWLAERPEAAKARLPRDAASVMH